MKYNMDTAGVTFNAAIIVKIKKMYNNIRKLYVLNMYRAFLMIDKYGRGISDNSYSRGPIEIKDDSGHRHYEEILTDLDKPESSHKLDGVVDTNKKTAISMMARIFKKNLDSQVKKWNHTALPEKRLEAISSELASKSKEDYEYVAKIGAIECISKMSNQIVYKSKIKAFKMITQNMFNKRNETDHDESLNERLDLLNRLNAMME